MTGSPFSWENRGDSDKPSIPTTSITSNDYIDYSYAKYLGGHPIHIEDTTTSVYVYNDRLEIVNPELVIPYSAISNIQNMDKDKISAIGQEAQM